MIEFLIKEKLKAVLPDETKISVLQSLEVGEWVVYPIEARATLRTYCSEYGLLWRRKFITKTNRTNRTVIVVRNA